MQNKPEIEQSIIYRGHEILIRLKTHDIGAEWELDIRLDDYSGEYLGSWGQIESFNEALARGKAFVDGFCEGIQNGKKSIEPSQEVKSLNRILKTMAEETARICKMTTAQE